MIPVFRSCCCVGGVGGRGDADVGAFLAASKQAAEVSSDGSDGEGPLGWRKRPEAGRRYRLPPLLYRQLQRAQQEPVFVQSRCGTARDCIPDDRTQPSYYDALGGAYAWIRLAEGRYVDIFSEPGRALLAHLAGSSGDYVDILSTDRDQREMQLIQSSPNAGRFGFLPP